MGIARQCDRYNNELSKVGEFSVIERLTELIPSVSADLRQAIGDDAAIIEIPSSATAVSTDTLNEGVHFFPDVDPESIGHKSLAVSLSDIAAMGARPRWVFLNLSIPEQEQRWLDQFATGFARLAAEYGVVLAGGDTTRGPLSITTTVMGDCQGDQALLRSGACDGDLIFVSGCPGRAALALRQRIARGQCEAEFDHALDYPQPRVDLGLALAGIASACVDVSDGLVADLGHVLKASGLGAVLDPSKLPDDAGFTAITERDRWSLQLSGGDDYELCFTVPAKNVPKLHEALNSLSVQVTSVGMVRQRKGLECRLPGGELIQIPASGWDHFETSNGELR